MRVPNEDLANWAGCFVPRKSEEWAIIPGRISARYQLRTVTISNSQQIDSIYHQVFLNLASAPYPGRVVLSDW